MTRRVLADAGISLDAHCAKLLDDGVQLFQKSYRDLIDVIRERSAALMQRR
jgi:hypothetical protein